MSDVNDEYYPLSLSIPITVFGISAVLVGICMQELSNFRVFSITGTILFGLGMSASGVAFLKICIGSLESTLYKKWRGKYIEIFTERREEEASKYSLENKRITKELMLLSVSGGNAFKDLADSNSALLKALRNGANLQLIIINPVSTTASERAKADNPTAPEKSLEEMKNKFLFLEQLVKKLNEVAIGAKGKLEVRITGSPLFTTIYCHQDKLIFGSYFPEKRGGNYGSYSISKKFNEELYEQYQRCFVQEWARGKAIICKSEGRYTTTLEYCELKSRIVSLVPV